MRLVQLSTQSGNRRVAVVEGDQLRLLNELATTYQLAQRAIQQSIPLQQLAGQLSGEDTEVYEIVISEGRILAPLDHPDPYRFWATGTGLTHLGSAASRDAMHTTAQDEVLTDSMKLFRMGVADGRLIDGQPGSLPEWFYKGNGLSMVAPFAPIPLPDFALDGGDEAEIAGLYVNDALGQPHRVGFALANEFSDHVLERQNYLYLAHSKLRAYALGPELLLGELPAEVRGVSRVFRAGAVVWEREFLTGEAHMSHNIANLEFHHFQYGLFRQPGDVHCHFYGAAVLSFSEGIRPQPGDTFDMESPTFGKPLRNQLVAQDPARFAVRAL
ncbi:MAG: FAH family protein [Cytophagaceae bacterium]|nr:FAH family protein [Cytophagaceae bacterium]